MVVAQGSGQILQRHKKLPVGQADHQVRPVLEAAPRPGWLGQGQPAQALDLAAGQRQRLQTAQAAVLDRAAAKRQHIVDESLLNDARAAGITPALAGRVRERIAEAGPAATVLCTCSTIGGCAEQAGALRVDRAMAERAVASGPRIILAATSASTLEPTRRLLEEVAAAAGRPVRIAELLCADAWAWFEAGDQPAYLAAIAAALRANAAAGDVIVLTQASMAGAAALCPDLAVPILSSPRLGLEAALARLSAA